MSAQRAGKGDLAVTEIKPGIKRARLRDKSALHRLLRRRQINSRQFEAGQRLYSDWYSSGYTRRSSIDPDYIATPGRSMPGTGPTQADYDRAMVLIAHHCGILAQRAAYAVCIEDRDPPDLGPTRTVLTLLRRALDTLADHYAIP